MVFFGTTDRENPGEIKTINQIYGIKDKGLDSILSMKDLENVTFGVSDLKTLEGKEGWFINLEENKGEKALGPPVVIFGVAYFSTFTPSINSTGGIARFYAVNYKNGNPILNLNPSNEQNGVKIDLSDRSKVIGTGIPSNTVISALDGLPVAFTGFSGGVYNTPLRKDKTILLKSSGRSSGRTCDEPGPSTKWNFAPGIASASSRPIHGGVNRSRSPVKTRVGALIFPMRSSESC